MPGPRLGLEPSFPRKPPSSATRPKAPPSPPPASTPSTTLQSALGRPFVAAWAPACPMSSSLPVAWCPCCMLSHATRRRIATRQTPDSPHHPPVTHTASLHLSCRMAPRPPHQAFLQVYTPSILRNPIEGGGGGQRESCDRCSLSPWLMAKGFICYVELRKPIVSTPVYRKVRVYTGTSSQPAP